MTFPSFAVGQKSSWSRVTASAGAQLSLDVQQAATATSCKLQAQLASTHNATWHAPHVQHSNSQANVANMSSLFKRWPKTNCQVNAAHGWVFGSCRGSWKLVPRWVRISAPIDRRCSQCCCCSTHSHTHTCNGVIHTHTLLLNGRRVGRSAWHFKGRKNRQSASEPRTTRHHTAPHSTTS